MHDVLRERVWRRIQSLPQEQIYQVLDYIEFLEAKYAREQAREPDVLQKFAERVEDSLRMRSVAPRVISGTVGLLGSARRVMRTVSDAGRDILGTPPEAGARPPRGDTVRPSPGASPSGAAPSGAVRPEPETVIRKVRRTGPAAADTTDAPANGNENQENHGSS